MKPKRRGFIQQRYWLATAYRMASAGKSYAEIRIALPKMSVCSLARLKRFMGYTIYHPETLPKIRVIREMRDSGYTYKQIAKAYGKTLPWAYNILRRYKGQS